MVRWWMAACWLLGWMVPWLQRWDLALAAHDRHVSSFSLCCVQMASALAHLYKHGVAHLDVKPDNIYLQVGPLKQWLCCANKGRAYCCEGK